MIVINIDPNIARIGPFLLSWHGVFSALGIFLGVWLPGKLLSEEGVTDLDTFYPVGWWAVAGGIVGARLLFVLEHLDTFVTDPLAILRINEGGISVFGGFIGGAIVGSIMAVRRGIPLGRFADAAAAWPQHSGRAGRGHRQDGWAGGYSFEWPPACPIRGSRRVRGATMAWPSVTAGRGRPPCLSP